MSLYLYALLSDRPRRPLGHGLAGEPLRVVRVGSVLAVVGTAGGPPALVERTLRRHHAVVARLARLSDAILPVRFGTLLDDDATLAAQLRPRARSLRTALALVKGREQMTLRLYGPAPLVASAADREDGPGGPGARYLGARLRAHRLARAAPEAEPLRQALGALIVAERVERHDSPPLVASLYHLVERGASRRYLRALDAARCRLPGTTVTATGPWPPYAFAPVEVA